MWEVNSQPRLTPALLLPLWAEAPCYERGGGVTPSLSPLSSGSPILECPVTRNKGFLPGLSCSANEDDSTGAGSQHPKEMFSPVLGSTCAHPQPILQEPAAGDVPRHSPKGALRTFKPTQRVGAVCCCGRRRQRVTPLAWGAGEQRAEGRKRSPAGWKKRELLPPWEYPPEAFSLPFGKDERNTVHLLCRRVPVPPQPSSPSPSARPPDSKEPLARGVNK